MDPDIGTSQGCLKGQITPEHLTLGTGVRQPLGQYWFLSLTGILPLLCFGCFGGAQLHIGLSLSVFQQPPSSQSASPYQPHPGTLILNFEG